MSIAVLTSFLAAALAWLLAREARLRRAVEALSSRLIKQLRHGGRRWPPRQSHVGRHVGPHVGRCVVMALAAGGLLSTTPEAQAGWFDWLWPASRHEELERAVDAAQQTAATACQLVESHSEQAAAQADQNARVADLLGALAVERKSLADHVARFEERSQRDSVVAAAISAAVPAIVSSTALLLGAMAIWAVTRPGPLDAGGAADMLELAAALPASDQGRPRHGRRRRLRDAGSAPRLSAMLPSEQPRADDGADDGDLPF